MSEKEELILDLLQKLHDSDWVIRYNAARMLGAIDAEEAINEIITALKHEPSRDVRSKIAEALGKIDIKEAIEPLIHLVTNDGSMIVRYTAARALGRIGATVAITPIKERLKKETNPESIFWFNIALIRLEKDPNGEPTKVIDLLIKKKLLPDKLILFYKEFIEQIKKENKKK